ncbi:MAG: ABC transporter ATP-binding protein [Candidatus Poseidoniia archaeon]|nr:ABC transporter ATP-binding protein [Candidatus Poseidoniia archaeon]MDP7242955.1 ABC transporter ATP-binding protein [Candidatus Poseidoniia archaeon]MDP7607236.1 ABC transporter ATP-binding protein [Candidatus Poseidoniia archaeon]HJP43370.1 ABC transporter ATP-binding protein [Candidatus Poseidoniia archaeon]
MIQVQGLTRYYGKLCAVRDISFEIHRGEVFGLLGSNGAGKSTTIKMLCGLLKPTRGSVSVAGVDLARKPLQAKAMLGYLPENPVLYDRLTGMEMLELVGALRKLSPKLLRQRAKYYSEALGLGGQMQSEVGTYSKGMRQKLAIAMTLVHDPEVVLLDEPAAGLDPRYTRLLKEWVRNLSQGGHTVLLSTHITEMASSLCDRIAVIDHGRLLSVGTVPELLSSTSSPTLEDAFIRLVG